MNCQKERIKVRSGMERQKNEMKGERRRKKGK
jgi:hypothetical protein